MARAKQLVFRILAACLALGFGFRTDAGGQGWPDSCGNPPCAAIAAAS